MALVRRLKDALPQPLRAKGYELYMQARYRGDANRMKHGAEIRFWRKTNENEHGLWNAHMGTLFTEVLGVTPEWYADKRMLDVGCGPIGTLEWATMARERVGLDPLVDDYRELGIDRHAMRYVKAHAEHIPFADGYFDVVSTFNSLDHVDDLDQTISEIKRVVAPGGTVLLMVEVNHPPTFTEPISFSWDIVDRFAPLVLEDSRRFGDVDGAGYACVLDKTPYVTDGSESEPGWLVARFRR